jgi:hypothetical protein
MKILTLKLAQNQKRNMRRHVIERPYKNKEGQAMGMPYVRKSSYAARLSINTSVPH